MGHAFLKNREFKEIQGNSSKFIKIPQNLEHFATIGQSALFFILLAVGHEVSRKPYTAQWLRITQNHKKCQLTMSVPFYLIHSFANKD